MIASWRPACCSRLLARVHEHSWPIVCLLFQHFHKHNSLPYHLGMYERSSPSSKELHVGSRSYNNSLLPVFSFLCTWTIACTAKTGSALPPWSSIWFRLCRRRSPCRSRQWPPDCRAPATACTSRSDESKIENSAKNKIVLFFGRSCWTVIESIFNFVKNVTILPCLRMGQSCWAWWWRYRRRPEACRGSFYVSSPLVHDPDARRPRWHETKKQQFIIR